MKERRDEEYYEKEKKSYENIFYCDCCNAYIAAYYIHQSSIHLKGENELRLPLGKMVEVDGHNMSVYIEGTGDTTLVFMSGGGTCSPILDFKSLYSLLSDKYQMPL